MKFEEVQKHNKRSDVYIVIHKQVYNITSFLDAHPGGEEVLMDHKGDDATEAFEDIGHSEEARQMLSEYLVDSCEDVPEKAPKKVHVQVQSSPNYFIYLLPVAAVAFVAYFLNK